VQYDASVNFFRVPEDLGDLNFEILQIQDEFIISHCIIQQLSNEFVYGEVQLDGLMLCKEGIDFDHEGTHIVCVC